MRKTASFIYKINKILMFRGVDPNKEKHRRKFYDSIGKPLPPVKVKKEPTSSPNTRKPPESSKPSNSKIEPTEPKVQKKKRTPNVKNKSQPR